MIKKEKHAELRIYFESDIPDDTKISFIKYIHEHLKKYAENVNRVRSYICPKCNELVEKSRVMKRIKLGKKNIICDNCDHMFPFDDVIEKKFGSNKFTNKVAAMDSMAAFNIDNESKELILVGHAYTTVASAGHIFRIISNSNLEIDGEIEFRNSEGNASGKKVYVRLRSLGLYQHITNEDNNYVFRIKNEKLVNYWKSNDQPVMLVIRDSRERIRWMNVTKLLSQNLPEKTKSFAFSGEDFTPLNVDNLRKKLYPDI